MKELRDVQAASKTKLADARREASCKMLSIVEANDDLKAEVARLQTRLAEKEEHCRILFDSIQVARQRAVRKPLSRTFDDGPPSTHSKPPRPADFANAKRTVDSKGHDDEDGGSRPPLSSSTSPAASMSSSSIDRPMGVQLFDDLESEAHPIPADVAEIINKRNLEGTAVVAMESLQTMCFRLTSDLCRSKSIEAELKSQRDSLQHLLIKTERRLALSSSVAEACLEGNKSDESKECGQCLASTGQLRAEEKKVEDVAALLRESSTKVASLSEELAVSRSLISRLKVVSFLPLSRADILCI